MTASPEGKKTRTADAQPTSAERANPEELLRRANQNAAAHPDDPKARRDSYFALRTWLEQHAFLAYVSESEKLYRVRTGTGIRVDVPKDRAAVPAYPPLEPSPLRSPSRWLRGALAGLLLAGIPTLVCVPMVVFLTLAAWVTHRLDRAEKAHAVTLLLSAVLLLVVGAVLSALFLIHIIY